MEDKKDYPKDILGQLIHFMYTKWEVSDEPIKYPFTVIIKK